MNEQDSEQTQLLREILKWTKILSMEKVKSILDSRLAPDSKKIIYTLSDGTKGTKDIANMVGDISHMSVANYWKEWAKAGIGELIPVMGGNRFKKSFDLEDFGITIPEIKQRQKEEQKITDTIQPSQIEGDNNDQK